MTPDDLSYRPTANRLLAIAQVASGLEQTAAQRLPGVYSGALSSVDVHLPASRTSRTLRAFRGLRW